MGFFSLFSNTLASPGRGNLVPLDVARKIADDWVNVDAMLRGSSPAQLKQALITADKLLDSALRSISSGESMSERLKDVRPLLDRVIYQKMWDSHRMRNTLVHEVGFEPQHFILKEAVINIKDVLYKLGVNI